MFVSIFLLLAESQHDDRNRAAEVDTVTSKTDSEHKDVRIASTIGGGSAGSQGLLTLSHILDVFRNIFRNCLVGVWVSSNSLEDE